MPPWVSPPKKISSPEGAEGAAWETKKPGTTLRAVPGSDYACEAWFQTSLESTIVGLLGLAVVGRWLLLVALGIALVRGIAQHVTADTACGGTDGCAF